MADQQNPASDRPSGHNNAGTENSRDGGDRKRKFNNNNNSNGRGKGWGGGRGGGRDKSGGRGGRKAHDQGQQTSEKRDRSQQWQQKRRKVDEDGKSTPTGEASYMSIRFSEQEIAAEDRKPKRKVAVLIGYAGTGYHGLQINHKEKTIEGDIFAALVAAEAISKANADDPRKSSFVRCARTDKGVHAAGNMISLKLIIEDPDLVKKINDHLPPQIRVWGIQRTNNAFSCYNSCDSRWYEYLMPSYCLLPPHHQSFLGKKVLDFVKEHEVEEEYSKRLHDVKDYWEEVDKNEIQPILDSLDDQTRESVLRRLQAVRQGALDPDRENNKASVESAEESKDTPKEAPAAGEDAPASAEVADPAPTEDTTTETSEIAKDSTDAAEAKPKEKELHPVDQALKKINAAYVAAKRRYRVTPDRLSQLQEALDMYLGTRNYHNYTIQKNHSDPSAKRLIKSFVVNPKPVQINDTEWLSLKVHGQSFMMHQIRKMVGMAVLATRCATPMSRITESYGPTRISIPKAPGLGLLLERPVFDSYNTRAKEQYSLPELDFGNHEKEIQEFKDAHIYQRIFELEETQNSFHTFFHQIDNFKSDYFLWVTAGGIEAAQKRVGTKDPVPAGLEDDEGDDVGQGGEGNEG